MYLIRHQNDEFKVPCQLTELVYRVKDSNSEGLMYSFRNKFMNIGLKQSYKKLVFPAIGGSNLGEN